MRRFLLFFLLMVMNAGTTFAQNAKVPAGAKQGYKTHKVAPKENWYSVGRIYGLSPRDIAAFNDLTIDNGLKIGQVLKIPTASTLAPSEVSHVSNKPSASASNAGVQLSEKPSSGSNAGVQASGKASFSSGAGVQVSEKPSSSNVGIQAAAASSQPASSPNLRNSSSLGYFAPGFEQQSKEGKVQKLENSVYGIFKSTSGWQDSKFYVLMNNVVPGTIVQLRVISTEKRICAKVLGSVPAGKESEGVDLRISNATASALGIADTGIGVFEVLWYN